MPMTIQETHPMQRLTTVALSLAEQGWVPDAAIRRGIRRLLRRRLREIEGGGAQSVAQKQMQLIERMSQSPVALVPDAANAQHYEVPVEFFRQVLGPHLKYSSAFWPVGTATLAEAEAAGLRESCAHADLRDGQTILELGCGWGSLTLWMATQFPNCRITAVSNSNSQRAYIESQARSFGVDHRLEVVTCDMNSFETHSERYDRVVSVEMFEHMRNYQELMRRISSWLKPAGSLFVHIFSHRALAYPFEIEDEDDWMARYFFTGGLMPSADLLLHFQDDLVLEKRWQLNGYHYQRTCEAWLVNQDRHREEILAILRDVYGADQATRWFQRWRMFFMACAELFGYRSGAEWGVSHYLFRKPTA